jgi:cell division septum initiation protein DivIVA
MSVLEPRDDGPDTDTLLRQVIEIVEGARGLPLSSSVRLESREEVLDLLDEALARLPEEQRQARWLVKEKQEFLDSMQREADDILDAARLRAERMVQRTEIVREAGHLARRIVQDARDESRRLRLEAEDYCDQKLAEFEVVLERTLKTVVAGRRKLSANPSATPGPPVAALGGGEAADETLNGTEGLFDQDQRA